MSKTVLGRNLGALLGGTNVPEPGATGRTLESANAERLGPGLRRLLRGVEAEGISPGSAGGSKERSALLSGFASVPAWYFFGADLALLLLACILVWPGVVVEPGMGTIALAMISVLSGALLAIVPFVRPAFQGLPKEVLSRWVVTNHGTGEAEKVLMVYAHHLVFVGEVRRSPGERVTVVSLGVEGSPPLSPSENRRLSGEAAVAYRELIERRGKQFRASLL